MKKLKPANKIKIIIDKTEKQPKEEPVEKTSETRVEKSTATPTVVEEIAKAREKIAKEKLEKPAENTPISPKPSSSKTPEPSGPTTTTPKPPSPKTQDGTYTDPAFPHEQGGESLLGYQPGTRKK